VAHVAKRAAGGLGFHDLPHSYATWSVSAGVPINVVRQVMEHQQACCLRASLLAIKLRSEGPGRMLLSSEDLGGDEGLEPLNRLGGEEQWEAGRSALWPGPQRSASLDVSHVFPLSVVPDLCPLIMGIQSCNLSAIRHRSVRCLPEHGQTSAT
jgi:hypothetical protein